MAEEKIKQNAEEYAESFRQPFENPPLDYHIGIYDGYIAGAHSRDEEIKELNAHIVKLMCERDSIRSESEYLVNKLRNPWISVEDRLPRDEDYDDENICCFLVRQECGFIYNCAFDGEEWLTTAPDGEEWGVGCVTHWMPIPSLKGE